MDYITDAPADRAERRRVGDEVRAHLERLAGGDPGLLESIDVRVEQHPDDPSVQVVIGTIGGDDWSPPSPQASW